jgi:hypothetical protein
VDQYAASYYYNDLTNVIEYDVKIRWKPIVTWLAKQVEPWQITHRSRAVVMAFSPLRVTEQMKKVNQIKEWHSAIQEYALTEVESYSLYDTFMQITLDAMELDHEWIRKYIGKHSTSSIGGGYKWRDLYGWSKNDWEDVYSNAKGMLESMKERPGQWINVKWNTGLRARSAPLDGVQDHVFGELDRTRIIQFHPVLSLLNVFLPHKKDYFQKALNATEQLVGTPATFHYPYKEGGHIYDTINQLYNNGYQLNALDGKTWEATVGELMGPAFTTLMMFVGGIPMLPSGGFHTSVVGTMANVVQNRKTSGHIVALGDDMSIFTKNGTRSRVPWVEEDADDTLHKVTLGVSYGKDIDNPRITGFKAMSDRAKSSIAIRVDMLTLSDSMVVQGKKTMQETALWAGLYLGRFGDKSLIEILRGIDTGSRDYISPGEIIEQIVSGEETTPKVDPFAWAEELGIKKLITK